MNFPNSQSTVMTNGDAGTRICFYIARNIAAYGNVKSTYHSTYKIYNKKQEYGK